MPATDPLTSARARANVMVRHHGRDSAEAREARRVVAITKAVQAVRNLPAVDRDAAVALALDACPLDAEAIRELRRLLPALDGAAQ